MTGIGLMIGELGFSAVRSGLSGEVAKLIESTPAHAPLSLLIPRLPGEPLRLDCVIPLHPRGTGCEWPPEAVVSADRGSGRFPLAAAWAGLRRDRADPSHGQDWVWHIDGHEQSVRSAEAIATAASDLLKLHPMLASNGAPTLVIPNLTREADQQTLLDAARRAGVGLQLLWRPVAAALAWCDHFDDFLHERLLRRTVAVDQSLGQLACLHVGLAEVELTLLDLVPTRHNGQLWIMPARRRPDPHADVMAGLGWLVLEDGAKRFLSFAGLPDDRQWLWQILFASNWANSCLARFEAELPSSPRTVTMPTGRSLQLNEAARCHVPELSIRQRVGDWQLLGLHVLPQASATELSSWSRRYQQHLPEGILGAVVSGEMAAIPLDTHMPLGMVLLDKLFGPVDHLLYGGEFLGRRILSRGAALFSARVAAGLPTYLDTLPQLQLLVCHPNGDMDWVDLLEDRDKYVPGGRVWDRPTPVTGLAIQKHKSDLVFAVYHEEHSNIRELPMELPRTSEHDEPVELHVSITPAQGNARLEVFPLRRTLFAGRRVRANWSRMTIVSNEQGGADRQAYVDHQPRAYPELMPRLSSRRIWRAARREIASFLAADDEGREHRLDDWNRLKNSLLRADQAKQQQTGGEVRAVSSDGHVEEDQDTLARLIERLWFCLQRTPNEQTKSYILRCLAYVSAGQPAFSEFLVAELPTLMPHTSPAKTGTGHALRSYRSAVLLGSGHCLRMPEQTRVLARCFVAYFRRGGTNYRDWLQALQGVLRYRKASTRDFETDDCDAIVDICSTLLREQLDRAKRGEAPRRQLFALAARVIAFLLRRRAFDADFLEPSSDPAMRVKNTCAEVMELVQMHEEAISKLEHAARDPNASRTAVRQCWNRIAEHRSGIQAFIGGTRYARQALQQIIDYVDRRGIGLLQIAAADDEE